MRLKIKKVRTLAGDTFRKAFQSAASKNGSYSVGITALVVGIIIVVNLIAGQIPESVRNIDISDNRLYEITDTSRDMLKELDQKVTFRVFAEKSSADERIRTFLEKYAALSDEIQLEWVDPVLHPSELTENNVEENTILVSCEDTEKTTTISFDDILMTDEYSYYMTGSADATEFDGEGQLTSAVNYVTSDSQKKIYYTTGHGEKTFSDSVNDLIDKSNMTTEELNLLMTNEIPEDCDLLFLYSPTKDITEDEKTLLDNYLKEGGKIYILYGDTEEEIPNLDALLNTYGIERADGYIADMSRNYQGNYYYIFPQITAADEIADGLTSDMVLVVNAHGFQIVDPAEDTVTTTEFMSTSDNAYAVTEESQEQGTYSLGAVAEIEAAAEDDSEDTDESEDTSDSEDETTEEEQEQGRLTVVSADTLIDEQITEGMSTLENLDLFMNTISANFDDVENTAIEAKSLEVTYNTMQHAGWISLGIIFGIPLIILVYGTVKWWKRRKA